MFLSDSMLSTSNVVYCRHVTVETRDYPIVPLADQVLVGSWLQSIRRVPRGGKGPYKWTRKSHVSTY